MVAAPGINDNEDTSKIIYAHRNEPLFVGIIVFESEGSLIFKGRDCIGEVNPMFVEIGLRFGGVPFIVHRPSLYAQVYISASRRTTS